MIFKNLKIRTKLISGFVLLIIMVIGLGWLSFFQTKGVWQNTSDLYNHPFKVNMAVRDLQISIGAIQRCLKDFILAEDDFARIQYEEEMAREELNAQAQFKDIFEQYLGSRASVDSAFSIFSGWKQVRDTTMLLAREGRMEEAAYRTTHSAEQYRFRLLESIATLKDFAQKKGDEFYFSAEKAKDQLQTQLWMIILLIFFLSTFLAYYLLRSFTLPLKELMTAAEKQSNGNYRARVDLESSNEMGQLAVSFNHMADSIEKEITIKNGITAISDSMLGKDQPVSFVSSLIHNLLSHTESNVGAIYFLNEEKTVFEPKFALGLNSEKLRTFSARSFDGEFGLTLLEKKMIVIRDIPPEIAFDFSAVVGNFKPSEIINIPIVINEEVVAIISLASLRPYSHEIIEMLEIARKNLTAGIQSMLSQQRILEDSQRIDRQNTELGMQSKELRLQTDELFEQNAELEMQKRQISESDRLKSEFLSSMSHELRTPLNAVIALSGVLNRKLKGKVADEEYSYLEIIERNGKSLLTLINEILDLSRIEAGKESVQLSKFSLNEAVMSILDTLQVPVREKGLLVTNSIEPEFPLINTDRNKVHHILQNLIGNAVKFTDQGTINITAEMSDSEIRVSIKDTGIGISAEDVPKIFAQFQQVDGTDSRKHEGTGLGLAIADKYSQILGARIEVASEPGKGSEFTLVLPRIPLLKKENNQEKRKFRDETSLSLSALSENFSHYGGKTILIVEDSEPAIIQLSDILQESGFNFAVARNGEEALQMVQTHIPDAIILDLMMPGMDGFEVLEKMRSTPLTALVPVLILTAKYLTKSELNRLTANNIHQLVQKGDVGKEELLTSIREMMDTWKPIVKKLPKKAVPATESGKYTILLVEDNEDNIKTIEVLLGGKYKLEIARDGQEGIDKSVSVNPDLILLDISLPKKDGFLVLEEIRGINSLEKTPVIAVTARAMKGDKDHFINYGFDDYVSKPINHQDFEEMLSRWISDLPMN